MILPVRGQAWKRVCMGEKCKEARYYAAESENRVRCLLCPHHCRIAPGKYGICLTRGNEDGKLISYNYCRPAVAAIDPVEKKPLYHFCPGTSIYSMGPNGCTFKCPFCQNSNIANRRIACRYIPPEDLVGHILSSKTIGAAYTYSEPVIWFETIMDIGSSLREHGKKNVVVTNGYVEQNPLNELLRVVDAMNIDIKSMNPSFYRRLCKGRLEHVLRACETVKKRAHLEVTYLIIPGENDSDKELSSLAHYIADHLGGDTPLHLSRYFPRGELKKSPTPQDAMMHAWEIARDRLDYVYLGNMPEDGKNDTFCPRCGRILINRRSSKVSVDSSIYDGTGSRIALCPSCSAPQNIIVSQEAHV
jgi:pyruvate formate lyase activating enzyme